MKPGLKWTLILLPAAVGGYFIYKEVMKYRNGTKQVGPTPTPPAGNNNIPAPSNAGCSFPLKKGSKSECVRELQQAIINRYGITILPKYGADGNWGSETDGAVQAFLGRVQINNLDEFYKIINDLINSALPAGGMF